MCRELMVQAAKTNKKSLLMVMKTELLLWKNGKSICKISSPMRCLLLKLNPKRKNYLWKILLSLLKLEVPSSSPISLMKKLISLLEILPRRKFSISTIREKVSSTSMLLLSEHTNLFSLT